MSASCRPLPVSSGPGGLNNNFNTPTNWSGNSVPGAADTAIFSGDVALYPNANKTCEVTLNTAVGAIQLGAAFTGSLTVDPGQTLGTSVGVISGGTLDGSGTLAIIGTAAAPGLLSFQGATDNTISNLTVDSNSSLSFFARTTFNSMQITDAGTATWYGGSISLWRSTFTNFGLFSIYCNQRMFGRGTFINNGTVLKTQPNGGPANGTTAFNVYFHNALPASLLQVQTGTLTLLLTLNDVGQADVAAGATLSFFSGTYTIHNGAMFSGWRRGDHERGRCERGRGRHGLHPELAAFESGELAWPWARAGDQQLSMVVGDDQRPRVDDCPGLDADSWRQPKGLD